jgi:hypothetical protein
MSNLLDARMDIVREEKKFPPVLLERLETWIKTAPEEAVYRINPLRWAKQNAVDEDLVIDLYLHAARAGIFDILWSVLCTQCGLLVNTQGGLRAMSRGRRHCRL